MKQLQITKKADAATSTLNDHTTTCSAEVISSNRGSNGDDLASTITEVIDSINSGSNGDDLASTITEVIDSSNSGSKGEQQRMIPNAYLKRTSKSWERSL